MLVILRQSPKCASENDITNYVITVGEDCIHKMQVEDNFADAGIEVIPSIYATAGASGVIQKETFDYIEACFLRAVREHQAELDGIYLLSTVPAR